MKAILLKLFQCEMKVIFTFNHNLFNTVVYAAMKHNIIMHNFVNVENWNQLEVWKQPFFSSDLCYKKMLLESLNIPLSYDLSSENI